DIDKTVTRMIILPHKSESYSRTDHPIFLKSNVTHRDPHSFPTRRSSDLGGYPRVTAWRWRACCRAGRATPAAPGTARARQQALRSEEHTSELQSRGHLVCRLLLEKKKVAYSHAYVCGC